MQLDMEGGIQLVGLRGTTNHRSCRRHASCGEQVVVGTHLRLYSTRLGAGDEAVACHAVVNGRPGCRVGFLSRVFVELKDSLHGRSAIVVEVCKGSPCPKKRRLDYVNKGMALCILQ